MAEKFRNKFRIKLARWKNWDYGNNGLYFITICTHQKAWSFGEISDKGEMTPSGIGLLAHYYWHQISNHFSFVKLEAFVVMPNHLHGVIRIDKPPVETRHCLVSTITPEKHRFRNQGKHTISSIIGS